MPETFALQLVVLVSLSQGRVRRTTRLSEKPQLQKTLRPGAISALDLKFSFTSRLCLQLKSDVMSFGFAVGDFIAVGALCWKVYTRVKDSPGKYAELASEVLSLYAVIKETGDDFSHQSLTRDERAKMKPCQRGCEEVLHDLDKLLSKYESLGTKSQRNLDRVGFGMQDMNAIRSRLISNVTMLNTFNNA